MRLTEEKNRMLEMMGLPKESLWLLTEGRYSSVVNNITKDVMRETIDFLKSDDESLEWENYYSQEPFPEEYDDEEDEMETFMVFLNVEKVDTDHPFNIDAYQEWDEDEISEIIVANIEINPDLFEGRRINEFQAELKDMFRHEIEHLYQSVNPNKKVKFIKTKSFVKDVLQPAEIDAYLQGFYVQAKTKKVSMNQIIDEWIEQRKKHFKKKKDMDKVRTEFIKHGKKLFPKAKWI